MMNKDILRIYVAGPYSAKIEKEKLNNVNTAIDIAIRIFLKGHFPYIPHLTHYVDKRTKKMGISLEWIDYMKWHNAWLSMCDGFLYLSSSRGADFELDVAKKLGKKIFYSIDEIPRRRVNKNKKQYPY